MAVTTNTRKLAALLGASGAGIGTDGTLQAAAVGANLATQAELDALETETDEMRTNQAIIAIRQAADHNDVKYSLQDRTIDTYYDASGIDATPSNNHTLVGGAYSGTVALPPPTGGDSTDTSVSGHTILVFTTSRALTVTAAGNVKILVVGGGASGGSDYGGGGGAGGLVYDAVYAVTPNTYDMVRGVGGTAVTSADTNGNEGGDSTVTINGGAMQFTAKGGGAGGREGYVGTTGGSGGGGSYNGASSAATQAGTTQGVTPDVSIGYAGGAGTGSPGYNPGGGGGAGGAGDDGDSDESGLGGVGYNASAIFGTAVGDSGWFASGGGGGWVENGNSVAGTASSGGGTAGGTPMNGSSSAATANTGGGTGGGASTYGGSGAGGSGVILVRYANADFPGTVYNDLILQSIDTEAEAQPTKADMIMLVEDAGTGVGTVNTHIKGHISRDSGTTFTEGVLVDEGDWGTDKRILAFHDLDISGQPADQTMCYKITTHSASAVYDTKIHATSIGWK